MIFLFHNSVGSDYAAIIFLIVMTVKDTHTENDAATVRHREVVYYSCRGVVCSHSRLYKADKIYVLNKINEFRNYVAGGQYPTYPDCIGNVNKVAWNQTLAIMAQKRINTCPRWFWYNKTSVISKLPKPSFEIKPDFTKEHEYDKPLSIGNRSCDEFLVIEYSGINDTNIERVYNLTKYGTFDYIKRGQMEDFWSTQSKSKMYSIEFRRAEVTEVGCGYMLQHIRQSYKGQELLSYFNCIYCTYMQTKPRLTEKPCKGCVPESGKRKRRQLQPTKYKYLCQNDLNEYKDIPADVESQIVCVTASRLIPTVVLVSTHNMTLSWDSRASRSTVSSTDAITTDFDSSHSFFIVTLSITYTETGSHFSDLFSYNTQTSPRYGIKFSHHSSMYTSHSDSHNTDYVYSTHVTPPLHVDGKHSYETSSHLGCTYSSTTPSYIDAEHSHDIGLYSGCTYGSSPSFFGSSEYLYITTGCTPFSDRSSEYSHITNPYSGCTFHKGSERSYYTSPYSRDPDTAMPPYYSGKSTGYSYLTGLYSHYTGTISQCVGTFSFYSGSKKSEYSYIPSYYTGTLSHCTGRLSFYTDEPIRHGSSQWHHTKSYYYTSRTTGTCSRCTGTCSTGGVGSTSRPSITTTPCTVIQQATGTSSRRAEISVVPPIITVTAKLKKVATSKKCPSPPKCPTTVCEDTTICSTQPPKCPTIVCEEVNSIAQNRNSLLSETTSTKATEVINVLNCTCPYCSTTKPINRIYFVTKQNLISDILTTPSVANVNANLLYHLVNFNQTNNNNNDYSSSTVNPNENLYVNLLQHNELSNDYFFKLTTYAPDWIHTLDNCICVSPQCDYMICMNKDNNNHHHHHHGIINSDPADMNKSYLNDPVVKMLINDNR